MKKKFVIVGVLGTLVIGSVIGLFATTGEQRESAASLESNRAAVRKIGLPTKASEIYPDEVVLDADNAAPLIIVAAGLLSEDTVDNEAVVDALQTAAEKTACEFDREKVLDDQFLNSLRIIESVELLVSSARTDIDNQRFPSATNKILAADRIASFVASIPTPNGLSLSARAERALIVGLGDIMREFPKDEALMLLAQEIGKKTRPLGVLHRCLRSLVAEGTMISQKFNEDGIMEKFSSGYPADPWGADAVEARHLEGWLNLYTGLTELNSWTESAHFIEKKVEEWSQDERPSSYTLRETNKSFLDAIKLAAENVALRRILFVAASAFEQSRIHKLFNERIPVLGLLGEDPFRGERLEYDNRGTGFKIYSWGYDGLDSGGTSEQGFTFEDGDIGYRYSPSAQTGE